MKILLLKAGEYPPELRQLSGDPDDWFRQALQDAPVQWDVVRVFAGEAPPRPQGFDAVVMSGSRHSVTEMTPWMREGASYLKASIETGIPVLGVCFGHQLLGHAYGARVVRNPKGREIGTVGIRLTSAGLADPLFAGISQEFAAQTTHEDVVVDAPDHLVPLATNGASDLQAFRVGDCGRAVQFHPELSETSLRHLAESRRAALDREGVERGQAAGEGSRQILDSIRPAPDGAAILHNFLRWVNNPLRASPSPRGG